MQNRQPIGWTGLSDVTCVSASDCTAVGFDNQRARIEHWDGDSWATVTTPPLLNQAASRKTHGVAGAFDVDLPLAGDAGIECRSRGPNDEYEIVFTFADNLTSVPIVTSSSGTIVKSAVGPNPNQHTVDIAGMANLQSALVKLSTDIDAPDETEFARVAMRLLIGDSTGDGSVNSADISQTKSRRVLGRRFLRPTSART